MDHDRAPGISPFADPITPVGSVTPYGSQPNSDRGSTSALPSLMPGQQRYFHSRRVPKGTIEKPWMGKKDPKEKWVTIIPWIGIAVGLLLTGYLVYDGLKTVVNHKYCPLLDENFDQGALDTNTWTREVECGGFGNGQFEYTTGTDENSYVSNNQLYIKPSVGDASLIEKNGAYMNLTKMGICTSTDPANCWSVTNSTNSSIVNPVKSARLNTKKSVRLTYGKIEVVAKLPKGKWLWPAIWMLPAQNVYGPWPNSGEIDIIESRGNDHTYPQGGNNIVSSALHWGPDTAHDAWWTTNVKHRALHTTYSAGFNKFGLEWSQKYLFTYVNTRLLQVVYTKFNGNMWDRGEFPEANGNGTKYNNLIYANSTNAPFDQDFYLILNVAVGGTNGWFQDGIDKKPWVDASASAPSQFWSDRENWAAGWDDPNNNDHAMVVDSVKIWNEC